MYPYLPVMQFYQHCVSMNVPILIWLSCSSTNVLSADSKPSTLSRFSKNSNTSFVRSKYWKQTNAIIGLSLRRKKNKTWCVDHVRLSVCDSVTYYQRALNRISDLHKIPNINSLQNLAKGSCCSLCVGNETVDPTHTRKTHVKNLGKYLDKLTPKSPN